MILNYTIIVVLLIFLFVDYRKAVVFITVFAVNLDFFKFPIVGSVWVFLAVIAIILYCMRHNVMPIIKHPLFLCAILPLISVCLSMHPFSLRHFIGVVTTYVFPIVLFFSLKSEKDISFYIKCMMILLAMAVAYCFFEEITRTNPIMEWCYNHSENFQWMTSRIQDIEVRFGIKRSISFFCGEAAFATVCIYYWFILLLLRNNKEKSIDTVATVFLILLPFCVLLTGTRSAIIAFIIVLLSLLSWKSINNNKILFLATICATVLLTPYLSIIYDSIFYSNQYTMGSSEDMREGQWEIAMFYMFKNLWLGNGVGYHAILLESDISGIYGLEGMWLPVMINQGLLGVISIALGYIITLVYLIWKKKHSLIWVLVSFFVFKTLTTVVGVKETYYMFIIVFIIRYYDIREKSRFIQRTRFNSSTCL